MAGKDNTTLLLLCGAAAIGVVLVMKRSGTTGNEGIPGIGEEKTAKSGPLGITKGDVKEVFSKVSGAPVVGQIASAQWEISPWSVIGGVTLGPLGTAGGLVKDRFSDLTNVIRTGPGIRPSDFDKPGTYYKTASFADKKKAKENAQNRVANERKKL